VIKSLVREIKKKRTRYCRSEGETFTNRGGESVKKTPTGKKNTKKKHLSWGRKRKGKSRDLRHSTLSKNTAARWGGGNSRTAGGACPSLGWGAVDKTVPPAGEPRWVNREGVL